MTPARAAEVLRGDLRKVGELSQAQEMGADALEFLAWLDEGEPDGGLRVSRLYHAWNSEGSFLDYARAEWEKERKG